MDSSPAAGRWRIAKCSLNIDRLNYTITSISTPPPPGCGREFGSSLSGIHAREGGISEVDDRGHYLPDMLRYNLFVGLLSVSM